MEANCWYNSVIKEKKEGYSPSFGNPAIVALRLRSVVLRPYLSVSLPLSVCMHLKLVPEISLYIDFQLRRFTRDHFHRLFPTAKNVPVFRVTFRNLVRLILIECTLGPLTANNLKSLAAITITL
jgi:hypothetical protein